MVMVCEIMIGSAFTVLVGRKLPKIIDDGKKS
jgi:hypothetical protein